MDHKRRKREIPNRPPAPLTIFAVARTTRNPELEIYFVPEKSQKRASGLLPASSRSSRSSVNATT